jgi:hypothetical protein
MASRSPWQNGYFKRLISSVRRECLHQVAVFGNVHLPRMERRVAAIPAADVVGYSRLNGGDARYECAATSASRRAMKS